MLEYISGIGYHSHIWLSNETASWTTANDTCRLFQPEINFTDIDERLVINDAIEHDQKPWVGYVQSFTTFNYIGCWNETNLKNYTVNEMNTRTDVGICYSACRLYNSSIFAINGQKKCKCLSHVQLTTIDQSSKCNKTCNGLICGSNDVFMSVYQLAKRQSSSPMSTSCLTVHKNMTKQWKNCTDRLGGVICRYGTNGNKTYHMKQYNTWTTWRTFIRRCPLHGYQSTESIIQSMKSHKAYWLATVGTMIIYNAIPSGSQLQTPIVYGFANVSLQNKIVQTQLAFMQNESLQQSLCVNDMATLSNTTTVSSLGLLVTNQIGTESTSVSGLQTGLGVGLSLALIIGVASVIVIYLKQRKKNMKSTGSANQPVYCNTVYDDNAHGIQEHDIEEFDINYANNDYFILEKTDPGAKANITQTTHDSQPTAENVYDVSGEHARYKMPTEHVYNTTARLSSLQYDGSMYNHINISTDGSEDRGTSRNQATETVEHVYGVNSAGNQTAIFVTENMYNVSNHVDDRRNEYDHTILFHIKEIPLNECGINGNSSTNTVCDANLFYNDAENQYELSE